MIDYTQDDRRSDGSFRKLLDDMGAMVIINDGETILYTNAVFYDKTEYTKNDLKTLKYTDLFVADDKQIFLERSIKRAHDDCDGLPDVYFEVEILTKNGKKLYCELYPNTTRYKDKKVTLYTLIDKTKYRKTEKSLEEFFEYCPTIMYIKDNNLNYVKISKFYESIFGKSRETLIGNPLPSDRWPPKDAAEVKKEEMFVLETKSPLITEHTYFNKTYMITRFPINGDLLGGISMDITERKKMENMLKETTKKTNDLYNVLISLLNATPEMMWFYDTNFNFKFMSKSLKELKLDECLFSKKECMSIPNDIEVFDTECNVNGNDMIFEITKTPLRDENNNIIGYNGIARDVTEAKRRQNNILRKLEKLENVSIRQNRAAIDNLNRTINNFDKKLGAINGR
jgi:PAS domain S-box-containing protein